MRIPKRLTSTFAAAAAVAGFSLVNASEAEAGGYGCAGSLIGTERTYDMDGYNAQVIYIYWDGTYNCAVAVLQGKYAGHTNLRSHIRMSTSPGGSTDIDAGNFSSYAGPVKLNGIGKCISIDASTDRLDSPWAGGPEGWWGPYHCG